MRDIRSGPRIDVEALCWELVDGREACGLAVDLSSLGVRIERAYVGGPTIHSVPLQIEVPEIDEVIWARGEACYDTVVPTMKAIGGPWGMLRCTGYRITAAGRDMRMLEELVIETHRKRLVLESPGSAGARSIAGGRCGAQIEREADEYFFDFQRTSYARA